MKKYRLFEKIPVFDLVLIIVILVIAVCGFLALKFTGAEDDSVKVENKSFEVTVEFTNLSDRIRKLPQANETVFDHESKNKIGKVVSSSSEPYIEYGFSPIDGSPIKQELEDRHNIIVTFKSDAEFSKKGIDVEGFKLGITRNVTLSMSSLCATGRIIKIVEVQ